MKNNKIRLKRKAQLANIVANGSNFLIHWQPFNMRPVRAVFNWAHKVRSNDPAWTEFLQSQIDSTHRDNGGSDHLPATS